MTFALRFICVFLALVALELHLAVAGVRLFPGLYGTHAEYSDGKADGASGYFSLGMNQRHFFTLGYDELRIQRAQWDYDQRFAVAGLALFVSPWGLALSAGRIRGDYRDGQFDYADELDLWGGELSRSLGKTVVGLSFAGMDGSGLMTQKVQQYTGRVECVIRPRVRVVIRPTYAWLLDGRRLYSLAARVNYLPHRYLLLKAESVAGERAYYFDNELYTIFNQNETQTRPISLQADWNVRHNVSVMGKYIYSPFRGYAINYFVLGLRSFIDL